MRSNTILLILFFSATAIAQREPLLRVPIQVGNENVQIPLYEGDNVRTVATDFSSSRGISMDNLETLVRLISEQIQSDASVVVETPEQSQEKVSVDVTITVPLTFRIGEPLESAALRTLMMCLLCVSHISNSNNNNNRLL